MSARDCLASYELDTSGLLELRVFSRHRAITSRRAQTHAKPMSDVFTVYRFRFHSKCDLDVIEKSENLPLALSFLARLSAETSKKITMEIFCGACVKKLPTMVEGEGKFHHLNVSPSFNFVTKCTSLGKIDICF